jgi:hypothetical protein
MAIQELRETQGQKGTRELLPKATREPKEILESLLRVILGLKVIQVFRATKETLGFKVTQVSELMEIQAHRAIRVTQE